MQTATVSNPAFDHYTAMLNDHANAANPVRENDDNTTHYLFYPAEPIPYTEVVTGFILRGQVTPVLAYPKWDRWEDVPDGMRKLTRGIQMAGGENTPVEAMYEIAPNNIFNHIMEKYGHWGVTELTALRGMRPEEVIRLNIDATFFPAGVPATYRAIRERINAAASEVSKDHPDWATYKRIADDMVTATVHCERYDNGLVDEVESNIEKSKSSDKWQSTYCSPSLRAMARLERTRKDQAMNSIARNQADGFALIPNLLERIAAQSQAGITAEDLTKFAEQIASAVKQQSAPVAPIAPPAAPVVKGK